MRESTVYDCTVDHAYIKTAEKANTGFAFIRHRHYYYFVSKQEQSHVTKSLDNPSAMMASDRKLSLKPMETMFSRLSLWPFSELEWLLLVAVITGHVYDEWRTPPRGRVTSVGI